MDDHPWMIIHVHIFTQASYFHSSAIFSPESHPVRIIRAPTFIKGLRVLSLLQLSDAEGPSSLVLPLASLALVLRCRALPQPTLSPSLVL
jgi:hypothetical protein